MENIVDINKLKKILGYTDYRSVCNWCKQNRIPILRLGKMSYILPEHLNEAINKQLTELPRGSSIIGQGLDATSILRNTKSNENISSNQGHTRSKRNKHGKKEHSVAAAALLKRIDSAD